MWLSARSSRDAVPRSVAPVDPRDIAAVAAFREQPMRHGMPAPVIDELLDGLAARDGKTAETSPAVEEVTGPPPFTYAQWVAHNATALLPAQT
ncbi:hypothetical protein [Nonomuraea dietziae]|uniref:hypothetical protein n=1 Tax=Nonomuraea dietziae TaxID=65515 RepID=UPI00343BCF52